MHERLTLGGFYMKCTINDIAHSLQLSRNTVSKALKGSPEVSTHTQERVLLQAQAMGYFNSHIKIETPASQNVVNGTIVFLTKTQANDSEFWGKVLKGLEPVLSSANYRLSIATMSETNLKHLQFPDALNDPTVKGIIIVEICYADVCRALLSYHVPVVTVDMPQNYYDLIGKFDIITMENRNNVYLITKHLIQQGLKRFAFIGDLYSGNVGRGFKERYDSLNECLKDNGLKLDMICSILHETNDRFRDFEFILNKLKKMASLPDVFICGNDWTAIQVIYALQFLGFKVPRDVSVVGFDNIPASEQIIPRLTTINTPKEYLGIAAARQIIERINNPNSPCVISQYATDLILRDSTI